jgi:hypothetical protein
MTKRSLPLKGSFAMSSPTTRQAYEAIYELWDQALEDPKGIRVQLADFDKANHLRMRLHQARTIAREDNARLHHENRGHPMYGASIYDRLQVRIYTDSSRITWLYIEPRTADIIGEPQGLSQIEDTRWTTPSLAAEVPNSQPLLGSPTGIKLLTKNSESESNVSTDDSSSTPSTTRESEPVTQGLRRL